MKIYRIGGFLSSERGQGTRKEEVDTSYVFLDFVSKEELVGTLDYSSALEEAGKLLKKHKPELSNLRDDDLGYLCLYVFFDRVPEEVIVAELPEDQEKLPLLDTLTPYQGKRYRLKDTPDFSKEKDPSEVWE